MDSLPQYYSEGAFFKDTLFHVGQASNHFGVAGDPVPYTIRSDDFLTSLLLLCFIFLIIGVAQSKHFILRQLKNFFYHSHAEDDFSETSNEMRIQMFLVILSCLLLAISTSQFAKLYIADTFLFDNELSLVGLLFAVFIGYDILKGACYWTANTVFFSSYRNKIMMKILFFIYAFEGMLLFPVVMLHIYFRFSIQNAAICFGFIFIIIKIMTFYKSWSIFFKQNGGFFQTFLYFCTLEIVPLLILTGGLRVLIDNLKLNF